MTCGSRTPRALPPPPSRVRSHHPCRDALLTLASGRAGSGGPRRRRPTPALRRRELEGRGTPACGLVVGMLVAWIGIEMRPDWRRGSSRAHPDALATAGRFLVTIVQAVATAPAPSVQSASGAAERFPGHSSALPLGGGPHQRRRGPSGGIPGPGLLSGNGGPRRLGVRVRQPARQPGRSRWHRGGDHQRRRRGGGCPMNAGHGPATGFTATPSRGWSASPIPTPWPIFAPPNFEPTWKVTLPMAIAALEQRYAKSVRRGRTPLSANDSAAVRPQGPPPGDGPFRP